MCSAHRRLRLHAERSCLDTRAFATAARGLAAASLLQFAFAPPRTALRLLRCKCAGAPGSAGREGRAGGVGGRVRRAAG